MSKNDSPLARLRRAIKNPPMNGYNPHFKSKYATLHDVIACVDAACEEVGLTWYQFFTADPPSLGTTICDEKGEGIATSYLRMELPADPQKAVGLTTYFRRCALCTVFGIVGEEDDDGNAASPPPQRSSSRSSEPRREQKDTSSNAALFEEALELAQQVLQYEGRDDGVSECEDLIFEVGTFTGKDGSEVVPSKAMLLKSKPGWLKGICKDLRGRMEEG